MRKQQIQKQEQLTAYNRKTTHDIFFMTMEWLEKYIEIAGYYPDWENRKQIHNNNIKRLDIIGNPEKTEQDFLTQLFLFWGTLRRNLPFSDELKIEFYQWLNATKIDNNNCPKRLKHLLYGFNEVLEGRGEKLQDDIENMEEELDSNSPEYMEQLGKVFVHIQAPMRDEAEVEKSLRDKTNKDIKIEKKFSGDGEAGEKIFSRLIEKVSNKDFHFFSRKIRNPNYNPLIDDPSEEFLSSSSTFQLTNQWQKTNSEIIQEVKNNLQNWSLEKIITEVGNSDDESKHEWVLVHRDFQNDYNYEGKLNFNGNPVYRWSNFNSRERFEIKQVKNLLGEQGGYLTDEEIKWVVNEVKSNPNIWKIRRMNDGWNYLIHNSAQMKKNEIGTLIHSQQKFNKAEQREIDEVLKSRSVRKELLDNFFQNLDKWKIKDLVVSHNYHNGKWYKGQPEPVLIRQDAEKLEYNQSNGDLIIQPGKMYKVKDLTEAEKTEIGIQSNRLEAKEQKFISQQPSEKNDNNIGTGGIIATVAGVSVLVVGGAVVIKRKLSKKNRG